VLSTQINYEIMVPKNYQNDWNRMQQGLIVNPKMKQLTRLERCVRTWMGAGAGTGVAVAARDADSAS
jgi:hypothetical protein